MKILFLTQLFPYPPTNGGKTKTIKLIKTLSKKHQIHFVCFTANKIKAQELKKIKKYCYKIKVFPNSMVNIRYKKAILKIILSIFCFQPTIVFQYQDQRMQKYLKRITSKTKFDNVYIEYLSMCQYLNFIEQTKKTKIIYGEHNINWLSRLRLFTNESNLLKKIFFFIEAFKLYFYEKKTVNKFNIILSISNKDSDELCKLGVNKKKLYVLPTLFKAKSLFKVKKKRRVSKIMFLGLLSWEPNRDAFYWFYQRVLPDIQKKIANTQLWVIGDEEEERMRRLADKDKTLYLTGFVKNLDHMLSKADVFVVPVRSGSGLRIKTLKALSLGIPVVSTSMGIEGLELKNNKNVLIADDEILFAKQVIKVLSNVRLVKKISINSLRFIKKYNSDNNYEDVVCKVF